MDSQGAKPDTIASATDKERIARALALGHMPGGGRPDPPEIKAAKAEARRSERLKARRAMKKAKAEIMEVFGMNSRGENFQQIPRPGRKKYLEKDREGPRRARALVCSEDGERARRDLWFLASTVMKRVYPDLVERLHKPMCDFFIQKNPSKEWLSQDYDKNRLLLLPRGHFKTTINLIDCIQWMLAIPNVTIALFSGTEELTERMIDEVKQHFLMNGDFREMF
ncbi:MAG: hypothetical protein J2P13_12895, partial [Acidobacteria bacterium]|nr:hypothetical protein [Acidobacteriota bacterium]